MASVKRKFTSGLILGFPTTGKTALANELRKQGVIAVDSDDIMRIFVPEWYSKEMWKSPPLWGSLIADIVNDIGALLLYRAPRGSLIFLTNTPALEGFRMGSAPLLPKSRKLFYYMRSAEDAAALGVARGDTWTSDLLSTWVEGAQTYAKANPEVVLVELAKDEFLSDVLDFSHWAPTPEETAVALSLAAPYLPAPKVDATPSIAEITLPPTAEPVAESAYQVARADAPLSEIPPQVEQSTSSLSDGKAV